MLTGTAISYIVILVTLFSFLISTNGHYLVITADTIGSLSDDFNEEVPHKLSTNLQFPAICRSVPTNCHPFLLPFVNDTEVLIPSVDPVKQFKFTNASIKLLNELNLTDCFTFFPTGNGLNEIYALCLKSHEYEMTIVTYRIEYTEDLKPIWFQYGNEYGTHIDLDSPLVTLTNSGHPVVVYVANVRGNSKLYIKQLNDGGDVDSTKPLPSNCTGPYELQHLYQLYALLKCSNGFVHVYDANVGRFSKLPVQGISMIGRCANSSSFVMLTNHGNILLKNAASETLISIPFFKVTVNSFQLHIILSFACHWNGSSTQLYFTTSQDDAVIYYLSISLEHVARLNTVTEAHQMLKFATHAPLYTLQSRIVGSAWITELTDEDNNNVQESVLINIKTEASGSRSRLSDNSVYVLSYEDKPFHSHSGIVQPVIDYVDGETESEPENSNGLAPSTIGFLVTGCIIIAIILIVILIFFIRIYYRRYRVLARRTDGHLLGNNDDGAIEMQPMGSQTIYNEEDAVDGHNAPTNQGQLTTDQQEIATDFHPQAATDSHPQAATNFHPQVATDSHPRAATNFHLQAATNFHPQAATDSHPQAATNFHLQTATNSQPQTATFHPQADSDDNENSNIQVESLGDNLEHRFNYSTQSQLFLIPSEEVSSQHSREGQVTGALNEPVASGRHGSRSGSDDECTDS